MNPIVELDGLTRAFGDVVAVCDLTFNVSEAEVFGLVGPDGAGKTTTLRMLASLIEPTRGSARVSGHDVRTAPQAVKDSIGYMAQRFGLYGDLTVDENLAFYSDLFGVPGAERTRLLPGLLRMTRMEPFRKRPAGQLSGGMKQKLALMCTLIHRPKVLLRDEPTNGVDPVSRRDFWEILRQLVREGVTVLTTTSYLDEAERCDRVALVNEGRLIRCDTPARLKQSFNERCYEVSAPHLRSARGVLERHPGVLSVQPFGNVLHLFASADLSAIAAQLNAQLREITPSLEDIFIALVEREMRTPHRGAVPGV
jgi:ABC-2 type transport system ATP-binding protein